MSFSTGPRVKARTFEYSRHFLATVEKEFRKIPYQRVFVHGSDDSTIGGAVNVFLDEGNKPYFLHVASGASTRFNSLKDVTDSICLQRDAFHEKVKEVFDSVKFTHVDTHVAQDLDVMPEHEQRKVLMHAKAIGSFLEYYPMLDEGKSFENDTAYVAPDGKTVVIGLQDLEVFLKTYRRTKARIPLTGDDDDDEDDDVY